jgi:serine/threonine protein phosphatase 1
MAILNPKRLLTIGDIHGCRDMLLPLIEKVTPTIEDQLVFLGDYIDRGPDSHGVVDDLLSLQQQFPETVFLRGNHEQMLLDFLSGTETLMFLLNGGAATLASYSSDEENAKPTIPSDHLTFFNNLKSSFVCGDFIFVHAGLRPGVSFEEQNEHDMLWIRGEFINSDYDWGRKVVFGHSPQPEVLWRDNMIGLDTGAYYNGCLTCCDVLSSELWQVSPTSL